MSESRISLSDLFKEQEQSKNLVTIEKIKDDDSMVKVTPWSKEGGCSCELSITIPIESIKEIYKTDFTHNCCGKSLLVVELTLDTDFKISVSSIFDQQIKKFNHRSNNKITYNDSQGSRPLFNTPGLKGEIASDYFENSSGIHPCPSGTFHVVCNGRHTCVYNGSPGGCCGRHWCLYNCRGGRCYHD